MKKSTTIFVFIITLVFYSGLARAHSNILTEFNNTYPNSNSGANADCQLCHGQSTSTWNEYGWDLRQNNTNFGLLEDFPSININGGTTYLDEINASTQPGWTTGYNNNLYNSGGLTTDTATAPGGIGALDPVSAGIFQDVPSGHWAEEAIYKIYNEGITQGCSQNPLKFCPDVVTNREQMAVFLGRGVHGSGFTPPDANGIFSDVDVNSWAADWIEQAYNDGITQGCASNPLRYCPTVDVTRAQMGVFLLRAKHGGSYTPPTASGIFSDVDVNHWAADWIEQLYNEGITVGCGSNPLRFCPDITVTRAQMAVFLTRTFGL